MNSPLSETPCPRCGAHRLHWRQGRNSGRGAIGPTIGCGSCGSRLRQSDLDGGKKAGPYAAPATTFSGPTVISPKAWTLAAGLLGLAEMVEDYLLQAYGGQPPTRRPTWVKLDEVEDALLGPEPLDCVRELVADHKNPSRYPSEPDESDPACHLWNAANAIKEDPGDVKTHLYAEHEPLEQDLAERALIEAGKVLEQLDQVKAANV